MNQILDFLENGLLNASTWQIVIMTLIAVQVTLAGVSLFLHREQTHRGIILNPFLRHFFRFWTWFTTGMLTKDWVAIHRKHHAFCETQQDPHSPQIHGIRKVLFHGVNLYTQERKKRETIEKYGKDTPNDWIERNIYTRFHYLGIVLLALTDIALFGVIGLLVYAIQMLWIPFFAAGVINGIGHFTGYRNYRTDDSSRNITRFGFFIMGEELHNNHHAFPSSCKFAHRKGEHDIGWYLIKVLSFLKLCEIKKVVPVLNENSRAETINSDTVKAILTHKFNVLQQYIKDVIKPTVMNEYHDASRKVKKHLNRYMSSLSLDPKFIKKDIRKKISDNIDNSTTINTLIAYKQELQSIWNNNTLSMDEMITAIKDWCQKAEHSGISFLQEFAKKLSTYTLKPVTNHQP